LLPLVYLGQALNAADKNNTAFSAAGAALPGESEIVNIVVLQAEDRQFGLVVDEINDTEEIVVKPLSKQMKTINTFAGATIMGDGHVALILDVMGLAQHANVVGENRERAVAAKEGLAANEDDERRTMLLMQCGNSARVAMELSLVARLEEFKADSIETSGEQQVVQYRGEIMPLVRVSEVLRLGPQERTGTPAGMTQVVVYSESGRRVGLVVDKILDIVEESYLMQRTSRREGLFGSAVIQQKVTELLDVPGLIRAAIPDFFANQPANEEQ